MMTPLIGKKHASKSGFSTKQVQDSPCFCTFYCLLKMQIPMHLQIWLGESVGVVDGISLLCQHFFGLLLHLLLSGRRRNHKVFNVERQQKTTTHASLYFSSVSVPAAPSTPEGKRSKPSSISNIWRREEGVNRSRNPCCSMRPHPPFFPLSTTLFVFSTLGF